jgi:hypothetical protein
MEQLPVNLILTGRSDDPVFDKPMRILLVADNHIWMIPIDAGARHRYARGVQRFRDDFVKSCISGCRLELSEFEPPPQWLLPDDVLNELYGKHPDEPCRAIVQREAAWEAIRPYVETRTLAEAIRTESYRRWIPIRAADLHCTACWLYHVLHRYWAGGSNRAALLGRIRPSAPIAEFPAVHFETVTTDNGIEHRNKSSINACLSVRNRWMKFESAARPDAKSSLERIQHRRDRRN